MSDFEDKLNTLLSDPNAMAQVMQLAQSLSGKLDGDGGAQNGSADAGEASQRSNSQANDAAQSGAFSGGNASPFSGAQGSSGGSSSRAAANGFGSVAELGAMLSQLTGNLDPDLLRRLLPLVQEASRTESSETTALLHALRPFLRESRRDKVDRAAQLAKLIHLAKVFLTTREG